MTVHDVEHARRRRHLRLVATTASTVLDARPGRGRVTAQEVRELRRAAEHLRRCARRLPEHSELRAELLEAAEYYTVAADDAA